jgi:hypothetical protein
MAKSGIALTAIVGVANGKEVRIDLKPTSYTKAENPRYELVKGQHVTAGFEVVGTLVTMPVKTASASPATANATADVKTMSLPELQDLLRRAQEALPIVQQMTKGSKK